MKADYKQPGVFNKRVRFYDGQFLQDQDFIDEQKYHLDRQRRHNHTLHVSGIATGLDVQATDDNKNVRVASGTAVDRDGRQIVLDKEIVLEKVKIVPATGECWLYVAYHQEPTEMQTSSKGVKDNTRWVETPCLFTSGSPIGEGEKYEVSKLAWKSIDDWDWTAYREQQDGPPPPVLLAHLSLDAQGGVKVDLSSRLFSGLRLPDGQTEPPVLRATAPGQAELSGDLTVTGNVGIGTTEPKANLDVKGDLKVGGELSFDTPPMRMERFQLGRLSAIDLDGKDDFVQIKADEKQVLFQGGPFTIEGWVFLRTYANNCRLIDFGNGAASNNIVVYFPGRDGKPVLHINHIGQGIMWDSGPTPLPIGQFRWVHLAATFEPNHVAKLYLDGKEVRHRDDPEFLPKPVSRRSNYIGKSHWEETEAKDEKTNGYIDEVRIWDRALSEDEIRAYMHRRVNGDEQGLVACWDFEGGRVNNRVPGGLGGVMEPPERKPKNALRIPRDCDTGYSVKEWVAISASYVEAEVPEEEIGENLLLVQLDGRWFIRCENFREDRKTQPEVDVLFMPRGWVTERGSTLP